MKQKLLVAVIILLFFSDGIGQPKSSLNSNAQYLDKISLIESLITLKNYEKARKLFESINSHKGSLEYDYLLAKLNQQEKSLKIHDGSATSLAISPDGDLIVTGGLDSLIQLWSVKNLSNAGTLKAHHGGVTCLEFSRDGKWLVSGSRDKSVIIWDISKKEIVKHIQESSWNGIYDVGFNPDATQLGVTTWTFHEGKVLGIVHLFETKTWKLIKQLEPPSPHPVSAIDFSVDGDGVVYGTWGLSIHYYDFGQRNIKWVNNMVDNHEYSAVTSIEVNPDNEALVVGTKDSKVRLLDKHSGKILFEPPAYTWHNDEVNDVTFSSSGKIFASSSKDQSINLGDANSGQLITTLLGHTSSVNEIAVHPLENNLYSVSSDGYLNKWDLTQKQLEIFSGCPDPGYGRGLFYAQADDTGEKLAMACGKKIIVCDLKEQSNSVLDVATYYGIAFGDNNQLVVGDRYGKLSVWDLSTKQILKQLNAHDDYIQKVIYTGNSNVLTSSGKSLKLWDIESEKLLKSFEASASIQSFTLSSKYNSIILALSGGDNVILDSKSFEVKTKWNGLATGSKVVLSQDQNKFAVGQSNGGIVVYDTKSYRKLSELMDADGPISSLSFDQSGNYLISTTTMSNQTVKFWNLNSNTQALLLHEFYDIHTINLLGEERRFALCDTHGRVFLLRY
jgi:WD40 repeat protein